MAVDRVVDEVIDQSKLVEIPSPRHQNYFGLLGHAPDLDPILPVNTYWRLMDEYDPIFKLDLGMAHPRVFVGSRYVIPSAHVDRLMVVSGVFRLPFKTMCEVSVVTQSTTKALKTVLRFQTATC